MRRRRAELAADPGAVLEVLARGNARANELADTTLKRLRAAMWLT
jgi:tryptophanyl-tRNA synthetase